MVSLHKGPVPGEIFAARVAADLALIRDFCSQTTLSGDILRNPHVENPVSDAVKHSARHSAVLIGITQEAEPKLLVTKRQAGIRFAGHWCFPGGITDASDDDAVATALRESEEEIGLASDSVEVIGGLDDYYTQAGFKISPVIGLIEADYSVTANPSEVEVIAALPLQSILEPENYTLQWHGRHRGHFSYRHQSNAMGEIRIAGPTVSILIGLLEALSGFTA